MRDWLTERERNVQGRVLGRRAVLPDRSAIRDEVLRQHLYEPDEVIHEKFRGLLHLVQRGQRPDLER